MLFLKIYRTIVCLTIGFLCSFFLMLDFSVDESGYFVSSAQANVIYTGPVARRTIIGITR